MRATTNAAAHPSLAERNQRGAPSQRTVLRATAPLRPQPSASGGASVEPVLDLQERLGLVLDLQRRVRDPEALVQHLLEPGAAA